MQNWKNALDAINEAENQKETLNTVLEAFLTSDYANCKMKRTNTIILFNHLQKLF